MSLPREITERCPECGERSLTLYVDHDRVVTCPHCGALLLVGWDVSEGHVAARLEVLHPCDDCDEWLPPDEMVGGRCPDCARESWKEAVA